MRYYIIAGEASGDLHGSNLIKSLSAVDDEAEFRFYGGDLMQQAGGCLVRHYRDTAVMGFVNVLKNAGKILENIKFCKQDIKQYKPNALILIDYPGFNLQIAKYAKKVLGLKVFYYIPPKVWAWKKGRIKQINKYTDAVYGIFPFEPGFYADNGCQKVVYVGNPCVQAVRSYKCGTREDFARQNGLDCSKEIIALLPGSRRQEVTDTIKLFNSLPFEAYANYNFVLAATSAVDKSCYNSVSEHIHIVYNQTYELLSHSYAAVVNSGTATLETALFNVPQVVCYPVNAPKLLYKIARNLFLKIEFVSLVNIICDYEAVKELVGSDLSSQSLQTELQKILDKENRRSILLSYEYMNKKLGGNIASDAAAGDMFKTLCCR